MSAFVVAPCDWRGQAGSGTSNKRRSPQANLSQKALNDYTAVMIVPTGIGASIGGYAGDALPAARLLASAVDTLITHPNVLNGAMMYWPLDNALYVEGYALDKFAADELRLKPIRRPRSNAIGLLLDQAIETELRLRHLQAADAARATLGLDIRAYTVTSTPVGIDLASSSDGSSWGTVRDPEALIRGAQVLVDQGCDAIAVVARFPDDEDEAMLEAYRTGGGVDAIAGAEAIVSHLVTSAVRVPCAHAPALPPLDVSEDVSPKTSAEELGYTFLPCVLVGLSSAPELVWAKDVATYGPDPGLVSAQDVDAVVVPASACGGSAVLSFAAAGATIIVVKDNETTVDVGPESLGISAITVSNYLEAAGVLLARSNGIFLPSLSSTIANIPEATA